jgi:hypothetical protein
MTADQYREALGNLNLKQTTAGELFQVGVRTSRRWAPDERHAAVLCPKLFCQALEMEIPGDDLSIASRVGLTPSPTCLPGQGGSRKGMRPFGNETGRATVSLPRSSDGGFMSDAASDPPNEREVPFVDPWSKEPNHQGLVPIDAAYVGTWDNDVGIFEITEALFLVRNDRQDLLWSRTTYSKSELNYGCVAGAPRDGTQSEAATRLLGALVRARVGFQFPRPPYLPGLLASDELSDVADAVSEELRRNRLAAEAAQQRQKAQIVEVAGELGLNPRPAGHSDSAWLADCPRRTHTLMLSPSLNEFGCGYCRRKGDAAALRGFVDFVRRQRP